ncbi:MAG: MlaD family protein, partial [Alphaproteobacteria bacterium]
MPMKRASEIKVGLFTVIALGAFLGAVLILTSKSSIWRDTITVHTSFKNIAGLIPGAEVRLSGVTVGLVKNISFSPREGDPTVLIELTIDDR